MYSVYIHRNKVNNKVYIGITKQKPSHRWGKDGNGYKQHKYFYQAIQKYGWDNFEHIILYNNIAPEEAYLLEQQLIQKYHSNDRKYGYNLSIGGEKGSLGITMSYSSRLKIRKANLGKHLSKEAKEKDRKAHLGDKNPMYGKTSPMRGVIKGNMSEEQKKKISNSSIKRKVYCKELNATFDSLNQAEKTTGINKGSIANVCMKRQTYAGIINDTQLTWEYLN